MGLGEFRKGRKVIGWISIVAFLFILFVSLQDFFLNYRVRYFKIQLPFLVAFFKLKVIDRK
ncbi:DUF3953 domain-containing protein [Neobacillus sp. OS1-2]|uniref:DUF3953 domain-containing protein n=1 Tax=Neobacillus sp. OS1-2 TaxID=3070680 RepID=UPI0027DEE2EB|nr:DUF3953 domain-containing protein [Neobacillus sp. OS1-2]WML42362.1 DUF3953 domain-containing protein [Neobacillus sp. OS1-2]